MRTSMMTAMLVCLGMGLALAEDDGRWQAVETSSEGFEIARREEPNRELPTMRGRGVLRGDILHLLAIVLDADRAPEWAEGVSSTKTLEREGFLATVVQSLIKMPWPVSDRDVIARGKLKVLSPSQEYLLALKAEPDARPEAKGVIRIRLSDVHFHLIKRGGDRVWVEYVANVDPGGKLPAWLVRWASRSIPRDTLRKLQTQLDQTRGHYSAQLDRLRALR